MRLAAGLHPDPLGELAVIRVRGKGRRGRKGFGTGMGGIDVKG